MELQIFQNAEFGSVRSTMINGEPYFVGKDVAEMKKYSGADELTQAMVQELIEKVVVTDPEHVEIVWKFKDEVRNFIEI